MQWTTGNVGKKSVHAIVANANLELVGCYAWSPDKVGHDVGELCGIEPLGIKAIDDIDALLSLKPDCVVYNPMFADVDEVVRILQAGHQCGDHIGVHHRTPTRREREAVSPTPANGAVRPSSAAESIQGSSSYSRSSRQVLSDRVDRVSIVESFDTTIYNSPATEIPMGFGYPIDQPDLPAITEKGSGIFRDAVLLVADALGIELDDVRCEAEYAQTTEDLHSARRLDHRKGLRRRHRRSLDRESTRVARSSRSAACGARVNRWIRRGRRTSATPSTVEGRPTIKTTLSFEPPADFRGRNARRLHHARTDHHRDAGDHRDTRRRRRRHRASPPTTTCRCSFRAVCSPRS